MGGMHLLAGIRQCLGASGVTFLSLCSFSAYCGMWGVLCREIGAGQPVRALASCPNSGSQQKEVANAEQAMGMSPGAGSSDEFSRKNVSQPCALCVPQAYPYCEV